MFTIKKLIFILCTLILLSIGNIHGLYIAHAESNNHLSLTPQTAQSTQVPQGQGLEDQLKIVTVEIQTANSRLEMLNSDITSVQSEINQLTIENNDLKERILDREKYLKDYYHLYQHTAGRGSYLDVLLNNQNQLISDTERTILKQQKTEKEDFKTNQEILSQKLSDIEVLQTELDVLQTQLPIQQKLCDFLKNQIEKNKVTQVVPVKETNENTYVQIVTTAGNKYIGRSAYVFGGGRNAHDIDNGYFDCSGFVHWVFSQAGIEIGNNTDAIKNTGHRVSVEDIQPGDLVFFDTYKKDGHVGIYLGDGKFIGSQCSTGIAVEDMTKGYWKKAFNGLVVRI